MFVGGTRSGTSTANIGDATAHGTTQLLYFINAELALALVKIESYCIHGWPPGLFCASLRDDEHVIPVGRTCHHVTVEVQPLHTN